MIIISAKYPLKAEEMQRQRDNILSQAKEGLILLQSGFITEYVGDDEDVVVRPYDYREEAINAESK